MNGSLKIVAEALAGRASVESVFGPPIVVGKRTYVPVARIQYGLGGGAQDGAGGGLEATPLGLLELTEEGASFMPLGGGQGPPGEAKAPGIVSLGSGGWLLSHQGRFALFNPPAPGAWLQHVAGPVVLTVGLPSPLFPQAHQLVAPEGLWQGDLTGEPLYVLSGARGVVFRGVLLLAAGETAERLDLPNNYRVHTTLS